MSAPSASNITGILHDMTKVATIGTRCRPTEGQLIRMRRMLTAVCYSDAQLAKVVGLSQRVVAAWRRKQTCHVESWVEDSRGRVFVPCWRIGERPNAPRPGPRETPAERMARLRAAKKGDK